jgi:hypothetical protein
VHIRHIPEITDLLVKQGNIVAFALLVVRHAEGWAPNSQVQSAALRALNRDGVFVMHRWIEGSRP